MRFKTPEPQASSTAPTLFPATTQGPGEPSPGLLCLHLVPGPAKPPLWRPGCPHPQSPSNPGRAHLSEALPETTLPGHLPQAQGCLGIQGQPGASAQPAPSSSGVTGPPAVGTRACQGRGDNAGSGTCRETRNGPDVTPLLPSPRGLLGYGEGFLHLGTAHSWGCKFFTGGGGGDGPVHCRMFSSIPWTLPTRCH